MLRENDIGNNDEGNINALTYCDNKHGFKTIMPSQLYCAGSDTLVFLTLHFQNGLLYSSSLKASWNCPIMYLMPAAIRKDSRLTLYHAVQTEYITCGSGWHYSGDTKTTEPIASS